MKIIKRSKLLTATTAVLVTACVVGAGVGVADAATGKSSQNMNGTVGKSDIPRTVFAEERLNAEAQILNTTPEKVKSAHQDHTFKDLISQAGLTPKTFMQKLMQQLTSSLAAKGYSQDQVTIALQHKQIVRLHHKVKNEKKGEH